MTTFITVALVYLALAIWCLIHSLLARASGRLPMTVTLTTIVLMALFSPAVVLFIAGFVALAGMAMLRAASVLP